MDEKTMKEIARVILNSANIREESYNDEKYEKDNERNTSQFGVDPAQYYEKTLQQACIDACQNANFPSKMVTFIYLSLHNWNDSLEWAEMVLLD